MVICGNGSGLVRGAFASQTTRLHFAYDAGALRRRRGFISQTTRAHFADDDESGASYTKEVMPTSASDSFLYVSRAVLLVAVCPGDSPSNISDF